MRSENKTVKPQLLPLEASPSSRLSTIRRFCMSANFMWLNFLCGAVFMLTGHPVAAAVFFLVLISALLFICDDVLATTLPFLLLCISVLVCYDSFSTFIKFIWLAPLPISALLFHFIRYARPITLGDSLWGHVGVSIAVILGGIGAIGLSDYFSGSSLYYIAMLGVGLLGAYVLMKSQIRPRTDYDIREKLITVMIIAGAFACLEVAYLVCRVTFEFSLSAEQFTDYFLRLQSHSEGIAPNALPLIECIMQPSNNLSTFLMISLPVTFYRAVRKNPAYALTSLLFLAGLFFTKSRSGLLLGGVEFVLCIIVFSLLIKRRALKYTFFALGVLILIAGGIIGCRILLDSSASVVGEVRYSLLLRSFEDFKNNPLFGQGIGSRSNADLYPGKTGTILWYHMIVPQVIGSMGVVGIIGYGLQLFFRVRLAVKKLSEYTVVFFMSYVGLLMMSQLNPGEFCPIPYGLIAVLLFIMIENEPDRRANKSQI